MLEFQRRDGFSKFKQVFVVFILDKHERMRNMRTATISQGYK